MRCVLISDPSTLCAGDKTRLESRMKEFAPRCICRLGDADALSSQLQGMNALSNQLEGMKARLDNANAKLTEEIASSLASSQDYKEQAMKLGLELKHAGEDLGREKNDHNDTKSKLESTEASLADAGTLPYLWPAAPVFQVVSTMQNVWPRLGFI